MAYNPIPQTMAASLKVHQLPENISENITLGADLDNNK